MASRLAIHNRVYRRRIGVSTGVSVVLLGTLLGVLPLALFPRWEEPLVAQEGPMKVLPQLDYLENPSERQETAAPRRILPTAFEVVELTFVDRESEREVPEPEPVRRPEIPDREEVFSEDDLQNAIRDRSVPVLARSQFRLVHFERPVYPTEALELGIEGTVEVMLLVGRDGSVLHAVVVEPGRYPSLERSAREGLARCRFRPHEVGGQPEPFWVKIPVQFELVDRGL